MLVLRINRLFKSEHHTTIDELADRPLNRDEMICHEYGCGKSTTTTKQAKQQ